jgi:hypothetical protein
MKRKRSDTLRILHRLPDTLSGLINEFANYGGLQSAPEIARRRLALDYIPDIEYPQVIQPDEVVTWVNINGIEQPKGPTSWANELKAKACARICNHLVHLTRKSIVIVARFTAQKQIIRYHLQRMGLGNIKVTTTTGALGTQANIVLFFISQE